MSDDEVTLVLTTREKAWWWSMQEVIPALEGVWTRIGERNDVNVQFLCVPLGSDGQRELLTYVARVTRIVITAATPETVNAAVFLRQQMEVVAPITIYVAGDSTEGFYAFGVLPDLLTEQDTFVVSCEAEAIATRCSFPNAKVCALPFPLVDGFKTNGGNRETRLSTARLAYVGRVSEQKNLHTLLLALWILRASNGGSPEVTLDVYGGEDGLGSPNMGLRFPDYGAYLRDLTGSLGLDLVVTWHGFKPREWLFDHVHLAPHILVSATLHSDENFGSSILASLVNGHQVVTTAWGGHLEFLQWFPNQLVLAPVHRSSMGPVVDSVSLSDSILRATHRLAFALVNDAELARARAAFSRDSVARRTYDSLHQRSGAPMPLMRSPTQLHLEERRIQFGGTRKIYADYADPAAQTFFEAYGMKEPLTFREQGTYVLPPWVRYANDVLHVDDPHRGRQRFDIDASHSRELDVWFCPSMSAFRLPADLVKTLAMHGYAFQLPPSCSTRKSRPGTSDA